MSIFSQIVEERVIYRGKNFFLIRDAFPVSPGHTLIISNEEKADFFMLTEDERSELSALIQVAKELVEEEFSPDGYNIGMNCGEAAGQTVMHFHCHLIPRYKGDMDNPRGGIRHCVSGKGYY
jgi:diadenosine tetraphosphate (Ap4A) HIT family hydrolase